MAEYFIPHTQGYDEFIVRRSRFIGNAFFVDSPETAREMLENKRAEHDKATHVVHAFRTGRPKSEVTGFSDDGEPGGTAGKPVMQIIEGSDVYDVMITVVRYYGGTKLGTGGLVKAYSESASRAFSTMKIKPVIPMSHHVIRITYSEFDTVKRLCDETDGECQAADYKEDITLSIFIPIRNLPEFKERIKDITNGRVII